VKGFIASFKEEFHDVMLLQHRANRGFLAFACKIPNFGEV
jgi:hypothetical protein